MTNASYIYGNLALDTYGSEPSEEISSFRVVNGAKGREAITQTEGSAKTLPTLSSKLFTIVMAITVSLILTATIFACIVLPFGAAASGEEALAAAQHQTITVQKGETLWDLARDYPVANATVKETVAAMRTWNDLDTPILQPGQSLIVAA